MSIGRTLVLAWLMTALTWVCVSPANAAQSQPTLLPNSISAGAVSVKATESSSNVEGNNNPPEPDEAVAEENQSDEKENEEDENEDDDDKNDEEENEDDDEENEPIPVFEFPRLTNAGFEYQGWLAQSYTWNPDRPANRRNGFQGLNDRANDYMLNQLGLALDRSLSTDDEERWLGMRADFVFGADVTYFQSVGFDDTWTSGPTAQFAIPQLFFEVRSPWSEDLTFQAGRFWTPLGYEGVPSMDRFFLSTPYTYMLAEPSTHLGAMANYTLNDSWSFSSGAITGWDVWNDNNDQLAYLGTANWISDDQSRNWLFVLYLGDESDDRTQPQISYSIIRTQELSDNFSWVFWHDFGAAKNGATSVAGLTRDAQWFGFVNELFYQVNDRWSAGGRAEWFRDDDGRFLSNSITDDPLGPGDLFSMTLGVNYRPHPNWLIRPEVRQDWGGPLKAFDDFSDNNQTTIGCDVIWLY